MKTIELISTKTNEVLYSLSAKDNTVLQTLEKAVKEKVSLKGLHLNSIKLFYANLEGADLEESSFIDVLFTHANLRGANLRGVTFNRCFLSKADLTKADLSGSFLVNTSTEKAIIHETTVNKYLLTVV